MQEIFNFDTSDKQSQKELDMNKIFIVIFVLAVTHKAYAVDLKKAKEFLSKKTPCHFAFSAKLGDEVPNAVFCVWD